MQFFGNVSKRLRNERKNFAAVNKSYCYCKIDEFIGSAKYNTIPKHFFNTRNHQFRAAISFNVFIRF